MSTSREFGDVMAAWARAQPEVQALVLIGSRQRSESDAIWKADRDSDWDFQIITRRPSLFADAKWIAQLPGVEVRAYASRVARIGGVPKVNALLAGAEADFVILPTKTMRLMKWVVALGFHRRNPKVRRALQDLAIVIRPGWKFLHGAEAWEPLYRKVVAEVPDPRLSDDEARQLAQVFACEQVWTLRKIARGELVAAQRMLHRELVETNFRLLHELKLRRGERSFPEARRIERIASESELASVRVSSPLEPEPLRIAVEQSADTCERLMRGLVGESWRRPA